MKKIYAALLAMTMASVNYAQTAINVVGTDINGQEIDMFEIFDAGQTVLLDFFFADCPPCNAMMPYLVDIHEEFGSDGLDLRTIGVSDRDGAARITAFEAEYGADWSNLPGSIGDGIINTYASSFFFSGFPTYSVVCSDRSITWDIWGSANAQIASDIRDAILDCGARLATGLADSEFMTQMDISPNPAFGSAQIQFALAESAQLNVSVFNLLGVQVLDGGMQQFSAGNNVTQLNVANLSNGNYLVVIRDIQGNASTMKLQIAR